MGYPKSIVRGFSILTTPTMGCPSEEDVTDGKMTLGFDISNDLKDERWSAHPQRFTAVARCCGRLKMVI